MKLIQFKPTMKIFLQMLKLETAHEMWGKLIETREGTSNVKSAKLFICKGKFEKFALLPNEELKDSFFCLNNTVNELKDLGFDVPEVDISHKFLRALPPKYETIVTLLVRSNLKTITPLEVLGEVLTHDIFKQSQELHGNLHVKTRRRLWHSRPRPLLMMIIMVIVRLAPMMILL
jgi:hypothetical protein